MARPDLENPEARAAYKQELRAVARMPRAIGFGFVLLGALLVIGRAYGLFGYRAADGQPDYLALGILASGWVFLVWACIAKEAIRQPSISRCGSWRMISRSLQVPGSDSSALTTR